MVIFINDEEKEVSSGIAVSDLFKELNFPSTKGVALAINNQIILQKNWSSTRLNANDQVLIISATKGG
ncbi:sulfur carrier protein ThiS [Labilibacter sediminis]|nr:sulfur carrier protein ThiS [Labilibacter sediminis]